MMEFVKSVHVLTVALSFTGFFVRGVWMLADSPILGRRWVKIVPQVVDTLLLVSAIGLLVQLRLSPLEQPWLLAKTLALAAYITAGLIALRPGRSKAVRLLAWLSALLIFLYIVSVAITKSVLGWLSLLPLAFSG